MADETADETAAKRTVTMKDFVRGLADRAGTSPKEARASAALVLAELVERLEDGTEVVLPKIGRIRQMRSRTGKRGPVRVLRLVGRAPGEAEDAEA